MQFGSLASNLNIPDPLAGIQSNVRVLAALMDINANIVDGAPGYRDGAFVDAYAYIFEGAIFQRDVLRESDRDVVQVRARELDGVREPLHVSVCYHDVGHFKTTPDIAGTRLSDKSG
ncbi:MAG: hypothetical protein KAS72_00465 [Phycisphaerales bacterium]|nr:hypothetical protein [Phycisphaerales bacterium]